MKKQHQRDFLEIEKSIKSRIKFLGGLGFTEEEKKIRKEELEIILKKLNNIRHYRLKPLKSINTIHGLSFKLGDKFHIPGDLESTYKIILFPNSVTICGESANPNIGRPWTCEVYVEDAIKVKEKKKKEKTKRKKKKSKNKK